MNGVGSTILQSILLTILWVGFGYVSSEFNEGEPPKAIVVQAESVELKPDAEEKELPQPVVQELIENQGIKLMTKEELEQATKEYGKKQWLLAGLSTLSGLATFFIGLKLFGHWGYASATLALGPIIVAYYFRYVANSPPAPNMPSS